MQDDLCFRTQYEKKWYRVMDKWKVTDEMF